MEKVTLSQAMRLLEVNNHRLEQLLEKTSIAPEISSSDRRIKLLTGEQVEQLRLAHIGMRRAASTRQEIANQEGNSVIATMLIRIATLERQVAALAGQRSQSARVERRASQDDDKVLVPVRSKTQVGQIGIGKANAAKLAVIHGANSRVSANEWNWQESDLADEPIALQFVKTYLDGHPRAGAWHLCDVPDCACHRMKIS